MGGAGPASNLRCLLSPLLRWFLWRRLLTTGFFFQEFDDKSQTTLLIADKNGLKRYRRRGLLFRHQGLLV